MGTSIPVQLWNTPRHASRCGFRDCCPAQVWGKQARRTPRPRAPRAEPGFRRAVLRSDRRGVGTWWTCTWLLEGSRRRIPPHCEPALEKFRLLSPRERVSEVLVGEFARGATARGALQESDLNEVRLVQV